MRLYAHLYIYIFRYYRGCSSWVTRYDSFVQWRGSWHTDIHPTHTHTCTPTHTLPPPHPHTHQPYTHTGCSSWVEECYSFFQLWGSRLLQDRFSYVHEFLHSHVTDFFLCVYCVYLFVCTKIFVCMYVYIYICVCMRVCMYVCMCVCMFAIMCVRIFLCTCSFTFVC